jgi:predicted Zn-dependent protease
MNRDTTHNHDNGCGCCQIEAFLAEPAAAYVESRRRFLRRLAAGGLTAMTLPLFGPEAEADIFKPTAADQKRLGAQAAAQVMQKYKVVSDERARRFDQVGKRLVNALTAKERATWDYRFRVIESKEVNAFALPGGNMFMFTGLMDRIGPDDELAAVTGHEMTHVRKEHWANAYASQQKRQFGLAVILGLTHANGTVQSLAGLGDSLYAMKYSRDEEDQADAGGLANMVAAGYDPHGMLDLFRTLQNATKGQGQPPEFLSDHPLTAERIKRTEERIARLAPSQGDSRQE